MPLTKPAVTAAETEQATRELINEWLKGWFNGGAKVIDAGTPDERTITFPSCELSFGQAYPTATKPVIHFVTADSRYDADWLDTFRRVKQYTTFNVFVRVQNTGQDGNAADHMAGNIADLLKLIVQKPSLRKDLSQKGILHAKFPRTAVAQSFGGWQVRFMLLTAELTYNLRS